MPQNALHVVLATDRPALHSFFLNLGRGGHQPLAVTRIPISLEENFEATLEGARQVAIATVAAVDIAPAPSISIELCQQLHLCRPPIPILALVCCPRLITARHLQALFHAGVGSILDLLATEEEARRVLQQVAHGDQVIHAHFKRGPECSLKDIFSNNDGEQGMLSNKMFAKLDIHLLQLLVHGMSDYEIGLQVHLSRHTVKHHIEHLRAKVGARNRTELAAWAGQNGFYHTTDQEKG